MIPLSVTITRNDIELLKKEFRDRLPDVKSTHRVELLSRWLGFRTYASLRAALASQKKLRTNVSWGSARVFLESRSDTVSSEPLYVSTVKIALHRIREQLPLLSLVGIGGGSRNTHETHNEYAERFRRSREELYCDSSVKAFLCCTALLSRVGRIKTISASSSYWVKHIAERFPCSYPCGGSLGPSYVPNGVLIAAAVHAGFKFRYDDGPNVCFNMSRRSLIDLDCEVRPNGAYG